jgi:C-terminal processing protease CtpA/Prc
VFALVNGGSFSATGEVASVLRVHDRVIFIGEETGAGRTGNSSGIMVGLTLPESKITITIPLVGYYMPIEPGPRPERGIMPDYEVLPTVEDLLTGRDAVMERALELAGRRNPRQ